MKHILWALSVFFSFFLQGRIAVLDVSPDLTLLPVYYIGMKYGETRGLLAGLVVGGCEDALTASLIGPHILSKGVVGYAASFFLSGGLFRWTYLLGILAVSVLTFADNTVVFLTRSLFDVMPAELSKALFVAVMQSLLNAPAGMFIRPKYAD